MNDDKRKAPSSGDDRALAGLAKRRLDTSPGIPSPVIDAQSEGTPPPMEPPTIPASALSSIEDMRAAIVKISEAQREQDVGLLRVWGARNLGGEVERLSATLAGLTDLSSVPELLRVQGARMAALLEWREASAKAQDRMALAIETFDRRLNDVNLSFVRMESQIAALSSRIGEVASSLSGKVRAVRGELDELGDRVDSELKKLGERFGALDTRIVSLENDRRTIKAWAVLIGFLAGLLAFFLKTWGSSLK
jgi:hypothetical protein